MEKWPLSLVVGAQAERSTDIYNSSTQQAEEDTAFRPVHRLNSPAFQLQSNGLRITQNLGRLVGVVKPVPWFGG